MTKVAWSGYPRSLAASSRRMIASLKRGTFWLHFYNQRSSPCKRTTTYLILILNENLLSGIRIQRKLERREQIRILERKPQFPLIITISLLKTFKNIIRYTFKFLSREPDPTILFIEILLELNLDLPPLISTYPYHIYPGRVQT
jgi:hypothetical protein